MTKIVFIRGPQIAVQKHRKPTLCLVNGTQWLHISPDLIIFFPSNWINTVQDHSERPPTHGEHSPCRPRSYMPTIGLNPTTQLNSAPSSWGPLWPSWQSIHLRIVRSQVQSSPDETPPRTLMAFGTCTIFQVPLLIILQGVPKQESHPLCGRSKL